MLVQLRARYPRRLGIATARDLEVEAGRIVLRAVRGRGLLKVDQLLAQHVHAVLDRGRDRHLPRPVVLAQLVGGPVARVVRLLPVGVLVHAGLVDLEEAQIVLLHARAVAVLAPGHVVQHDAVVPVAVLARGRPGRPVDGHLVAGLHLQVGRRRDGVHAAHQVRVRHTLVVRTARVLVAWGDPADVVVRDLVLVLEASSIADLPSVSTSEGQDQVVYALNAIVADSIAKAMSGSPGDVS